MKSYLCIEIYTVTKKTDNVKYMTRVGFSTLAYSNPIVIDFVIECTSWNI